MVTIITDLRNEFHPCPKAPKKEKAKPKPIQPGKKSLAWEEARKELKVLFAKWNIVSCEIGLDDCMKDNFLGFAHTERRIKLTPEEVKSPKCVALACQNCHHIVDFVLPREESKKLLEGIIAARKVQP